MGVDTPSFQLSAFRDGGHEDDDEDEDENEGVAVFSTNIPDNPVHPVSFHPADVIVVRVPVRVHDVPENSCACTGTCTSRRSGRPPASSLDSER